MTEQPDEVRVEGPSRPSAPPEGASDEAGQLLAVAVFLGAQGVPLWLFAEGHDLLPPPLGSVAAAGAGALSAPLRELVELGFAAEEEDGMRVPAATSAVVRDSMSGVERSRFAGLAVALLDRGFPERVGRQEDIGRSETLGPAVEAAAAHVSGGGASTARAAHLLGRVLPRPLRSARGRAPGAGPRHPVGGGRGGRRASGGYAAGRPGR